MKGYGLLASALALALSGSLATSAEAGVGARPMLHITPQARAAPPERRCDHRNEARFTNRFAPRRAPQNQQNNQASLDLGGDGYAIVQPTPSPTPTNEADLTPYGGPAYSNYLPPLEPPETSSGPRIIEIGPQASTAPTGESPTVIYGAQPLNSSGGPRVIYGDTPN